MKILLSDERWRKARKSQSQAINYVKEGGGEKAINFGNLLNSQSILFSKYQGNSERFSLHVLVVEICLDIGIKRVV